MVLRIWLGHCGEVLDKNRDSWLAFACPETQFFSDCLPVAKSYRAFQHRLSKARVSY